MREWQIAETLTDGRWFAPAAERNQGPILDVLKRELPPTGLILEIASGTGQHITHFAKNLPHLSWQPSDRDPACRRSISRWVAFEKVTNVSDPIALDVRERPWAIAAANAILCINMVHVAPWAATSALFAGAQQVLARSSLLYLYGPYRREGHPTAPSNIRFDAELRAHDPEWGLRHVEAIERVANQAGFGLAEVVAMPANNLSLIFRKDPALHG